MDACGFTHIHRRTIILELQQQFRIKTSITKHCEAQHHVTSGEDKGAEMAVR